MVVGYGCLFWLNWLCVLFGLWKRVRWVVIRDAIRFDTPMSFLEEGDEECVDVSLDELKSSCGVGDAVKFDGEGKLLSSFETRYGRQV